MKRLVAFLAVLAFTLTFAPVVLAGTQGSCSNFPGSGGSVRVWENVIGDTSDGNDTWYALCHSNAPAGYVNLNLSPLHTPPGGCHGQLVFNTWDDCIDSATVWLPSSLWRICFYDDPGYSVLRYWIQGPRNGDRWNLPNHDRTTSIRMTNTGVCE